MTQDQHSVYSKEDPSTIELLFDDIAPKYDMGNTLMSFGMHNLWNRKLVNTLTRKRQVAEYLDICSGTGEIAFRLLDTSNNSGSSPQAYLLDFSANMLKQAALRRDKLPNERKTNIHIIQGNAELLPFDTSKFDTLSIAYGIRNINNIHECFKESFRVLNQGGMLGILELTRPNNSVLRLGHRMYLHSMIPLIGKVCISNKQAYEYLCKSIENFICPQAVQLMLESVGFSNVQVQPLVGGIATLFTARK